MKRKHAKNMFSFVKIPGKLVRCICQACPATTEPNISHMLAQAHLWKSLVHAPPVHSPSHPPTTSQPYCIASVQSMHSSASFLQIWLPDSPRWLLLAGKGRGAAEGALSRAWGKFGSDSTLVKAEVSNMLLTVTEGAKAAGQWRNPSSGAFVACFVTSHQSFSGLFGRPC